MTGDVSEKFLNNLNERSRQEEPRITDVTDVIGKYGPWQRVVFILTVMRGIPTAFHNFGISFMAPNFDVWCARPQGAFQNWTADEWKNYSIPFEEHDGKIHYSRCEMYDISTDLFVNRNKTVTCHSWEYDHSFYIKTIVEEYNLVCDRDWLISLAQALYMGGMTVGVFTFGHLADRYGRQPILRLSVTLMLVAGIVAAFSTNYIFFCVARFFLALGVAGTQNTSFCLYCCLLSGLLSFRGHEISPVFGLITFVMEVLGPVYRTRVTFAFSFGWASGLLLLPGFAYLIRDWHYLQLGSALVGSVLLSYWCFMPESPRWLITQGKYKEAQKVMESAIKQNKLVVHDMPSVMRDLKLRIEKEYQNRKKNPSIIDLFKTSTLRRNTIYVYICYFSIAFVFYGLSLGQTNLGGSPFLNFFIGSAVELPAYVLCMIFTRYLQRRISFIIFSVIGGAACFFMILSSEDFFWLRLMAAMTGKMCISGAFIILAIHVAEIFPTVVRTLGSGSSLMMGRIGAMTAPFVKELGNSTHEAVTPVVFGSLSVVCAFLVYLLPETLNQNLPETIFEAETLGKGSDQGDPCILLETEENPVMKNKSNQVLENGI